jgi:hypothetical protein
MSGPGIFFAGKVWINTATPSSTFNHIQLSTNFTPTVAAEAAGTI